MMVLLQGSQMFRGKRCWEVRRVKSDVATGS